eukprot:353435-Chlamydomonas_euryale.AAC.13
MVVQNLLRDGSHPLLQACKTPSNKMGLGRGLARCSAARQHDRMHTYTQDWHERMHAARNVQ